MERESLPTVKELASLTEAFRLDPSSDAFVQLGNRLLALGRPEEAIEVGVRGLSARPDKLAGHMLVANAFVDLHRWKEAQVALLKVVKADRNHLAGFRLLGEVLLRREDFERALPVLQHAQYLGPNDLEIDAMVECARTGRRLGPPKAIPNPLEPLAEAFDEDAPTRVAVASIKPAQKSAPPEVLQEPVNSDQPTLGRVELQQKEVVREGRPAPKEQVSQSVSEDERGREERSFAPVEHHETPPPEDPLARLGDSGALPVPKVASKEPNGEPDETDEEYLNDLLSSNRADEGVGRPESRYDVSGDKTWGRSSTRVFVYLFVILLAGLAGGGGWYWYAKKKRAEVIAAYLVSAKSLVVGCDHADLSKAADKVRSALDRDRTSVYTMAVLAEVTGLHSLLYGEYAPEEVGRAVESVASAVTSPADKGYRELLIARTAHTLATMSTIDLDLADERLTFSHEMLQDWLERSPDDRLARWLLGRVLDVQGARTEAGQAFLAAADGGDAPVCTVIELANFKLDDGEIDAAMKLYDAALQRSPNNALAFVGRSLARSEGGLDLEEAMADITVGLAKAKGEKLLAWKYLATASAKRRMDDFAGATEALQRTGKVLTTPRFLARQGLERIRHGEVEAAAAIREQVRWFASDPEIHPLVRLLDAELLLARGVPEAALERVDGLQGPAILALRGRAQFLMGNPTDALKTLNAAVALSPDSRELAIWADAARMVENQGKVRREAAERVMGLIRSSKSKAPHSIYGMALAAEGHAAAARSTLDRSVEDLTPEAPNPLAYLSYLELARLDVKEGKTEEALENLKRSLKANQAYLPTHDLMAQVLIATDAPGAMEHLNEVFEAGVESPGAQLAMAQVLVTTEGSNEESVKEASKLIRTAKERGVSQEELQKAIAVVDPKLYEELEVPPLPPPPEK